MIAQINNGFLVIKTLAQQFFNRFSITQPKQKPVCLNFIVNTSLKHRQTYTSYIN